VMITAGAPVVGAFTIISLTSDHRQQSCANFKIGGKERRFPPQLTKDQKSKVRGLAPRYLYHRGKPKWPFETNARDNAQRAMRLGFFFIQTT
jgi:hypothetical protein